MALLLPYLAAGLKEGALPDYRAASLMVLAQLCARATLGDSFLAGAAMRVWGGGVAPG